MHTKINKIISFLIVLVVATMVAAPIHAQEAQEENSYAKAKVLEVYETKEVEINGEMSPYQRLKIEFISGDEKGRQIELEQGKDIALSENLVVKKGEKVIVTSINKPEGEDYLIVEVYRWTGVVWAFLIFFVITMIFGGKKGLGAIIGLAFSLFVLIKFVVPQIASGNSPVFVSLVGAIVIMGVGLYLAHGFTRKTTLSMVSILISLLLSAGFAVLFVEMTRLFGRGSEEAIFLINSGRLTINLKGLLLGGIIIGALGVLDDVATAQTAAVFELKRANENFTFFDLFERGIRIGKDHIASLVNTLALAYVGASFPLLILFAIEEGSNMLMTLNSESIIEEIVRMLAGSISLILTVPITTGIAAWYYGTHALSAKEKDEPASHHH